MKKGLAIVAFAGCIILAGVGGCGRDGATAPSEPPSESVETAGSVVAPPVLTRTSSEIQKNEPLDLAFRRLGLEPTERFETARAIAEEIDVRRILPGEEVEIARDDAGGLRQVVLYRNVRESVVVDFTRGGIPAARTVRDEPDVWVRRIDGEVNGSLYEAVLAAGGDADLVMRFADLLAWQVDFFTEPRAGDRFRLLVEELRLKGEKLGFGKILVAEYDGERASARATRWVDDDGARDWYDDAGKSVRRAFLKSPLNYRRISSRFTARRRHPILKTVRPHWGVDYAAPAGTPVSALGSGVVSFAGRKGGYGKYVEVRHNSTYTTCYGHFSGFGKGIRRGARVEQGQVIGYVGSTGLSTGPHLDFRVKRHGQFIDPLRLESPPGRALQARDLFVFDQYRRRAARLVAALPAAAVLPEAEAWARVPPVAGRAALLAPAP